MNVIAMETAMYKREYMKWKVMVYGLFLVFSGKLLANPLPDTSVIYKITDEVELAMHFFFPPDHQHSGKFPAILFFHGGGWRGGGVSHFYNQSIYFASRGLVAVNVVYRVEKQHGTSPIECVKDGKSAIRWVRSHAIDYGIDSDQIIASGGSAGGHVAAALAALDSFNEAGEDLNVSCEPQVLVLFNPVVDNSKEGFGFSRVKEYWEEFSPAHNIKKGAPPTLIMLGTKDTAFKPQLAKIYKQKMEELGNRCDLILYPDQKHAFFNFDINAAMHYQTMRDADIFLESLGYLKGKPSVSAFFKLVSRIFFPISMIFKKA